MRLYRVWIDQGSKTKLKPSLSSEGIPAQEEDGQEKVSARSGKPPQKRAYSRKKPRGAKLNKAIVEYLTTRDHPVTIKELKRQFKVSSGTLSVHLAELTEAKVTDHTASKRNRLYFMRKR